MDDSAVLFDCSLEGTAVDWVRAACAEAGVKLVDNEAVAELLSEDPAAAKALEQHVGAGENATLAPLYLRALEKLRGGAPRFAVVGLAWVACGISPACAVVDLSPYRAAAKKIGDATKQKGATFLADVERMWQERLKAVAADHILRVDGEPAAEKTRRAAEHLRRFLPA